MTITFEQVDYDMNSKMEIVATTLQAKVASQSDHGIGPASCWAGISYLSGGSATITTSFSQMQQQLEGESPYKNDWVKYHGELGAISQALWSIEASGFTSGTLPILSVYVEMSPCSKCMPNILGLLPDGTVVYYSFDYETQSADWLSASKKMCKN